MFNALSKTSVWILYWVHFKCTTLLKCEISLKYSYITLFNQEMASLRWKNIPKTDDTDDYNVFRTTES